MIMKPSIDAQKRLSATMRSLATKKHRKHMAQLAVRPTLEEIRAQVRAQCTSTLYGPIGDAIAEGKHLTRTRDLERMLREGTISMDGMGAHL